MSLIKTSVFEMLKTPPPYCTFREAFERAGFGCTYAQLEEQLSKVTINKEKRLSDTDALTVFSYTLETGGGLKPYRVVSMHLLSATQARSRCTHTSSIFFTPSISYQYIQGMVNCTEALMG